MGFSIRLTEEEKRLAQSYAKLNSMSVGEAFKRALFDKIEDEYDYNIGVQILNEMKENGEVSRPIQNLWEELGI